MLKDVLDQLGSLTIEEKRAVEEAARAAVARELGAAGPAAPDACPRCGCPRFVRKGRNRDGSQRWLCRGCGQTFSAKTMSLLGHSRLKPEVWLDYVSDMLSGASLRGRAELCGVPIKTSWFMRMRLCEVMARAAQPFRTGEGVSWQVDGTYLDESLTGNRSRSVKEMIDAEDAARQERKVAKLVREARFKEPAACVEDVIYMPERKLSKDRLARLAECGWVEGDEVLVAISKTGCGKSFVAQALGNAACRRLHPTRYVRLADLCGELNRARMAADGSYCRPWTASGP